MIFSGKINRLRSYAMGMIFLGIALMYLGYVFFRGWLGSWAEGSQTIMAIFLVLGVLMVLFSGAMYMWIGMLSSRSPMVECPSCGKMTKVLGRVDECMFCKQKLTLDPTLATTPIHHTPENPAELK